MDIVSAKYKSEYKIELTFENGRSGVVDFRKKRGDERYSLTRRHWGLTAKIFVENMFEVAQTECKLARGGKYGSEGSGEKDTLAWP